MRYVKVRFFKTEYKFVLPVMSIILRNQNLEAVLEKNMIFLNPNLIGDISPILLFIFFAQNKNI